MGTAYGIMNSIQNGGLALASVLVGLLSCTENTPHCTTPPLYLLGGMSGLTFLCAVLLVWVDLTRGNRALTVASITEEKDVGPTMSSPLLNDEKRPLIDK